MSEKKSKSAKCFWIEKDTRDLLAAYSQQFHLFDGTVRDAELYKRVQHSLAAKGIVREVQQIKDKIKLLKKSYKRAHDSNQISDRNIISCPFYEELNRIYGSKDSTSPKIKYDQGLKKKSCAPEQEIPKEFEVSLDLVDDPVCDPTTTLSPSTPHQLPSPVETPLEINRVLWRCSQVPYSPSSDEAGSSRLSQFRLPSSPLLVSCPTENVEPPPSSGLSANWLKRKRQPNASVRSADALSADTLSRKTAVERETLQRMAHAKKEHELRMAVMEEKVLMLRAKRAYYERGNKN